MPRARSCAASAVAGLRNRAVRRPGLTVVLLAAVPRLLVALAGIANRPAIVSVDSLEYLALADQPDSYFGSGEELWRLALRRPPGYPLLLAGPRALDGGVILSGLLQALLSVAVVWLTWILGRELLGRRVGFVAAVWVAVDPATIVHMGRLLTEAPYTVLLLSASIFALRALRSGSVGAAGLAGLCLAGATFVRPVLLYLPLLLLVVGLMATIAGRPVAKSVRPALAVLVAFVIPVGAWIGYVRSETGVALFSTIEGVNMLEYRAAGARASDEGSTPAIARDELLVELEAGLDSNANPAEVSRAARALGIRTILDHPVGFTEVAARGAGRMLLGPARQPSIEVTRDLPQASIASGVLTGAAIVSSVLMLLGAAWGIILLFRRRAGTVLVVTTLPIAYHLVVASGADSDSRFRTPLVPYLAILAACAAVHAAARWRRRHRDQGPAGVDVGSVRP